MGRRAYRRSDDMVVQGGLKVGSESVFFEKDVKAIMGIPV